MTVKEFKERANAKVQVLIQSNMLYDVYHSRTDENYLYVDVPTSTTMTSISSKLTHTKKTQLTSTPNRLSDV